MNTFKRKALTTAVLGTLGAAGTAHAIFQNANGLGQALVYPYYTVQSESGTNSWNTYISVVNTTTVVKVVKVRFREGKNSNEVLDFNLYLSPNDMWTGAVIPATSDPSSQARLVTADTSCTNPAIPSGGVDFRNYQYSGAAFDNIFVNAVPQTGLDRTREGYVEMFEMGDLNPTVGIGSSAVHNQSASPVAPTCTGLRGATVGAVAAAVTTPSGGLSGTGTLINVNSGRDTMYNAIAFENWRTIGPFYSDIGNDIPNFTQTSPAVSVVLSSSGTVQGQTNVYVSSWTPITAGTLTASAGVRAASATMMHSDVINEYVLDTGTKSNTDWVLTFPTKRQFVTSATVIAPFTNVLTTSGACETVTFSYFNREERSAQASGVDFSPLPPAAAPNSLCWESTIVSLRNGSASSPTTPAAPSLVLGSQNVTTVSLQDATNFQNGWADLFFAGANATGVGLVSDATSTTTTISSAGVVAVGAAAAQTFHGLPVVGFMIRTFTNNTLSCGTATCQGNYGGSAMHVYRDAITP